RAGLAAEVRRDGPLQHGLDGDPAAAARPQRVAAGSGPRGCRARGPDPGPAHMSSAADWPPSASRARLTERATLLARARDFFAARGVLEVDTPLLVNAPVSDVHLHSAQAQLAPAEGPAAATARYFLHTSPEYAMKRLLAAGSGDIYQICHVVRGLECGRLHNPEFTLIEWYRTGFTLASLMDEVEALVRTLLGATSAARASERLSYREAFLRELALDPFSASEEALARAAQPLGFRHAPLLPRADRGAGGATSSASAGT